MLECEAVSGSHAVIDLQNDGTFILSDCRSSNGTYIAVFDDQQQLTDVAEVTEALGGHALASGDIISFADEAYYQFQITELQTSVKAESSSDRVTKRRTRKRTRT